VPPFTQVHDINGGIFPNGLFWTAALPRGSFSKSGNGKSARLHVKDVPLNETFQLFGTDSPLGTIAQPATVSLDVQWRATGPAVARGSGTGGSPAEAFLGQLAPARAEGTCFGSELGFSFASNGQVSSGLAPPASGYAEIGTYRNGSFL
jgi:hypothetical protein